MITNTIPKNIDQLPDAAISIYLAQITIDMLAQAPEIHGYSADQIAEATQIRKSNPVTRELVKMVFESYRAGTLYEPQEFPLVNIIMSLHASWWMTVAKCNDPRLVIAEFQRNLDERRSGCIDAARDILSRLAAERKSDTRSDAQIAVLHRQWETLAREGVLTDMDWRELWAEFEV